MRVQAKADCTELIAKRAASVGKQWSIYVAALNEYHVYGLTWYNGSPAFGTGCFYEILDDFDNLISAPSDAFEVIDGHLDDWTVKSVDGNCFVWPNLFYEKYFFDDLSEGVHDAVRRFELLKSKAKAPTS